MQKCVHPPHSLVRLCLMEINCCRPPELRKARFLVMDSLLKSMPQDDPAYRFMDKNAPLASSTWPA